MKKSKCFILTAFSHDYQIPVLVFDNKDIAENLSNSIQKFLISFNGEYRLLNNKDKKKFFDNHPLKDWLTKKEFNDYILYAAYFSVQDSNFVLEK